MFSGLCCFTKTMTCTATLTLVLNLVLPRRVYQTFKIDTMRSQLSQNIIKIGKQAKGASLLLSKISSKQKNNAIEAMADNVI